MAHIFTVLMQIQMVNIKTFIRVLASKAPMNLWGKITLNSPVFYNGEGLTNAIMERAMWCYLALFCCYLQENWLNIHQHNTLNVDMLRAHSLSRVHCIWMVSIDGIVVGHGKSYILTLSCLRCVVFVAKGMPCKHCLAFTALKKHGI